MRTKTLRICSLICLIVTALIAAAPNVSIREFDVPTPRSRPHDPAVAPDGSLWYTGQMANKLGRLDPVTGKITEFPLKTPDSGPHGLVADPQGNIWFTANFKAYIGKLDPKTGKVTEITCLIHTPRIPILPCSTSKESCGSRRKNRIWSAGLIRRPGIST